MKWQNIIILIVIFCMVILHGNERKETVLENVEEDMRINMLTKDFCDVSEFTDLNYYLFCNTRLHKDITDWKNVPTIVGEKTTTIEEAKELYSKFEVQLQLNTDEKGDIYVEYVSPDCKWIITTEWINKNMVLGFGRKQILFYEKERIKESVNVEDSYKYSSFIVIKSGDTYEEMEEQNYRKYIELSDKVYSEEKCYDLTINEEGTLLAGTIGWEQLIIREVETGIVLWSCPLQKIRDKAQAIRDDIKKNDILSYPQVIQFQGNEKEGNIVVQGGNSSFFEITYPVGEITYLGEYMYSLCYSPDGKYAAYSDVDYDNGVDMDPEEQERMSPGIYILEVETGRTAYIFWDPFGNPDEDYMETRSFMWIEKKAFEEYMKK